MKRNSTLTLVSATLLGASLWLQSASGQVSIASLPGSSYTQTFDTLAISGSGTWTDNSTLQGRYAAKANNGTPSSFTAYTANAGTGTAGALYSFGASGSGERALGSLASGNASIGDIAYGVRFANDTAEAMTSLTITYTGEQWRNAGNATAQTLAFSYRVSAAPITDPDPANTGSWTPFAALDFRTPTVGTSAGALDGNASANRQVLSAVLSGAVIPPGSEVFLRWRDINDSGNDHAVAIDDLTVNFSSGEVVTNAPTYASVAPLTQTNNASTAASFTVMNDGYPPDSVSYQWLKDGNPLADNANISGSAAATLTITNLTATDAGGYDVIVGNSAGWVISDSATLAVTDPAILFQSASQTHLAGGSITLTARAAGTPTLAYQWCFDGSPLADETTSALTLDSLQATNQGSYMCWVTNGLGTGTSTTPITLTVVVPRSVTLAVWDFNDTNAPLASPPPSVGAGTASLLNGVTASFVSGLASDPGGTNKAWSTAGYPPQGTSNKTAGVQFKVSTLGYQNILLMWNERHSPTGSKYTRLQYTTDGRTFTDLDLNNMSAADTYVLLAQDLSGIPAVNNNPNFAFRVVSELESTANPNYAGTSSGYNVSGTIRFDLVSVSGEPFSALTLAPTTISNILGHTLTYGGGAGSQFVLLKSPHSAATLGDWTRAHTNFVTPGTFTVPMGSENAAFYRIKSE